MTRIVSISAVALLFLKTVVFTGCAAAPVEMPETPEELQQVILLIDEPALSGALMDSAEADLLHSDPRNEISQRVVSELRRNLQDQGIGATTDPTVDYDGILHVDVGLGLRGYDITMSVDVVLADARGDLMSGFSDRQRLDIEMASDRFGYRTPEYITRLAVQDLLSSTPARPMQSRTGAIAEVPEQPEQPAGDVSTTGPSGEFVAASPQRRSYALVIGVEEYRDLSSTEGARRDAEDFARLVTQGFGVPDENVRVLLDSHATRGDIFAQLAWFEQNVTGGDRIYLYFSGHGSPKATDGTPFLMPYEATPENLEHTGVELSDLIEGLERTEAREIIAFVDACFSGTGERSVLPEGTRPVVPEQELSSSQQATRVAVYSASGPSEISGNRADEDRGLFTHFLLEGLGRARADMDGDGQISLSELHDYVSPRVSREARQINRQQNPALFVADELGNPDEVILTWGVAAD